MMKKIFLLCIVSIIAFSLFGCPEKQKTEEERIRITIEQKKEEPAGEQKKEKEIKPEPRKQEPEKEKPKTLAAPHVQKETPPPAKQESAKKQAVEKTQIPEKTSPKTAPYPPPTKQEIAKKEELEKGPTSKDTRKHFSNAKKTMQKRSLLPEDIPGVLQDLDKAKALISSEKYKEASNILESVRERAEKIMIDKEFIDNKLSRLSALLKHKFPSAEAEKRMKDYKNKIGDDYNEGNYARVNKYLTKVILKIKGKKEEDIS